MSVTPQLALESGYILAVEDSMVQAKRLEFFFKTYQLRYQIYANAEEAYAAALTEKPELIISDIVMPGMDGYEFCKKVKNTEGLSRVPIILLTALQDPQDIIRGLQAEADNFITKPYKEKYLLSRMQHLLNNRETRISGDDKVIELRLGDQKYQIDSDKKQILELLLSVYEAAIQRNEELIAIKAELETANQNLTQANQELEAFSRTVSHDLRSPLNGIIGFSDLLLANNDSSLDDESKEFLGIIRSSAWSMANLIQDLLEFARSGLVEIEEELINLTEIATEAILEIRQRDPERVVNVEIEADLLVKADKKMMKVVLNNLLGNAFKYSANTENAEIRFGKKDYYGQNLFFVSDNGAGFDMAQAHKLFQPFQRLHSSNEFKGTGVGLSTVQRIVEKHGGQIWAESEINQGATFYFTLG